MKTDTQTIKRLRAAGKRVTPERELLVRIVDRNPHLDAAEIYRIAKTRQPRIGLATVYRTLNLLDDLGVIRSSELGEDHRHYEVMDEEHVHLVCSDCGRILDIPAPKPLHALAAANGFRVEQTRLEMIGYCASCAKKRFGNPSGGA